MARKRVTATTTTTHANVNSGIEQRASPPSPVSHVQTVKDADDEGFHGTCVTEPKVRIYR